MRNRMNGTWSRGMVLLGVVAGALVLAGCGLLTKQFAGTNGVKPLDDTIADGDGLTPVNHTNLAFGTVTQGDSVFQDVLVAITRKGNPSSGNVFANGASVTITVQSVNYGGGSDPWFTVPTSVGTINLPSDWVANGTMSDYVTSTVTLITTNTGNFSGHIVYAATGPNTSGATITRTDQINVTAKIQAAGGDTTPPTVTIVSISPNPTNAGTTVTWKANEAGTYSVRVGGSDCSTGTVVASGNYPVADVEVSTPIGATYLAEGLNTIRVCVTDASNNTGSNATSVCYDIQPPTPSASLAGTPGNTPWYVSDVTVTLSATDTGCAGVDYIQYSLDGGAWTTATGLTIATDGKHTLAVRAFDKAGNEGTLTPALDIWIDKTPPTHQKDLSGTLRDGYWRSAVTVTLTGDDATSGLDYIEYNLDGAGWQPYSTPFVITTPGVHTLCHRAYDKAGNIGLYNNQLCQEIIIAAGCSHGYWKNNTTKWPSPYTPAQLVKDVFSSPQFGTGQLLAPLAGQTLLQALKYTGTSTVKPLDAARILMLQAIAAVLNQAKYGAAFPYAGDVITDVDAALTKGATETDAQWRARMLALKTTLDIANNSMCVP